MKNIELSSFIIGVLFTSGIWFVLWRKISSIAKRKRGEMKREIKRDYSDRITFLETKKDKLQEENKKLNSELYKTKTELSEENNKLNSELHKTKTELSIVKLERDNDIKKLSDIVKRNIKDPRSKFAEEALNRLGYKCIYHDEISHVHTWEEEVEEEIEGYDCGGYCDSASADGTCYNKYCIGNGGGATSTYSYTETRSEEVIDSPAYVEVVKDSEINPLMSVS